MIRRVVFLLPLGLAFALGCGGADGPPRFRFSGTVSLDGQPVPFGEVIISPDASRKNSGPQGKATIKDGRFDTAGAGGMGIGGGPVMIRVNGMSAPGGKTLCEYEFPDDLPKADGTREIKIPKADANNANKNAKRNAPEI